ncbi:MAG: hypothetical protein LWX01_02310 [Deltaproteobacteria bacterium]|nr:hypothetical protein [Deltaproteobacteria bacterium]MDL1960534.1 hypothetical protein [Deltaproteobacteria bacterium]
MIEMHNENIPGKSWLAMVFLAQRILSVPDSIPRRGLTRISLPGRAGTIASST